MTTQLDDSKRGALRAFCETIVPRVERDPDPYGWSSSTCSRRRGWTARRRSSPGNS